MRLAALGLLLLLPGAVRLLLIDAPERDQRPYGEVAARALVRERF